MDLTPSNTKFGLENFELKILLFLTLHIPHNAPKMIEFIVRIFFGGCPHAATKFRISLILENWTWIIPHHLHIRFQSASTKGKVANIWSAFISWYTSTTCYALDLNSSRHKGTQWWNAVNPCSSYKANHLVRYPFTPRESSIRNQMSCPINPST